MSTETIVPSLAVEVASEASAIDLRRHSVRSELLGGERELVVFVPPGYDDEPQRRYPVLYMHDGQNLFDPETAYVPGRHWRLGETAKERIENGDVTPMIVVGVYHAGEKRIDEYTPTRDTKHKAVGKAEKYLRALTTEFKEFVDGEYRTLKGPQNTGVGGSSLGGLIALYAGLQCPQVFGKVAAMSPSIWWDRRHIVRMMKQILLKPRLSVWLDIGTKEGTKTLADVRAMRKALEAKGWVEGQDLFYQEVEGAAHEEPAWADRVGDVLAALFPASGELVAQ